MKKLSILGLSLIVLLCACDRKSKPEVTVEKDKTIAQVEEKPKEETESKPEAEKKEETAEPEASTEGNEEEPTVSMIDAMDFDTPMMSALETGEIQDIA